MKSAYELAMERLNQDEGESKPLSEDQKKELATIDEKFKAKIAEREIFLQEKLVNADARGDISEADDLRRQLASERARLEEDREFQKEIIRQD